MIDGGLKSLFQKHLPEAHWQSIETWSTGRGVPDLYYCFPGNKCGWLELKVTTTKKVVVRPEQIAWAERHWRNSGRVFFAVRKKTRSGVRRQACDELWIVHGEGARMLAFGLHSVPLSLIMGRYVNGPTRWQWSEIRKVLCS